MLIQLKDVEQLTEDHVWMEVEALQAENPDGKLTIAGTACWEISDECAGSIAAMFGSNDPGHSNLWKLSNGEPVGPEYVRDDIDHVIANLPDNDRSGDKLQLLQVLQGWVYLQVHNTPPEPMPQVPEESRLQLSSISVRDLIGRYVANMHGREFKLTDIRYDLKLGKVYFELADLDEDGEVIPDSASGVFGLEGFTVL